MLQKTFLTVLWMLLLGTSIVWSQTVNYDYVYDPNIKTVQVFVNNVYQQIPTLELRSNGVFKINWDDLQGDQKFFKYRLVHCDKYWNPSNEIVTTDYLRGFNDELVEFYELSRNTEVFYTYYELYLPNQRTQFALAGNYLLHIYEDDPEYPSFTKRLVVVDTEAKVLIGMLPSSDVSDYATHQEVIFDVFSDDILIRNPMLELSVVVVQNGDWTSAMGPSEPHRLGAQPSYAIYDRRGEFSFPGRREFRFFDMRSIRAGGEGVAHKKITRDAVYVSLTQDRSRFNAAFQFRRDFNGRFTIDNLDAPNRNISSKYALVQFELFDSPYFESRNLYVRGGFTEWQCYPENKMKYDENTKSWFVDILMKQGFYEYEYVEEYLSQDGSSVFTHEFTEGNSRMTENDYTVIVYYRPIGERYDKVIKTATINSLDTGGRMLK